MPVAVVEVEKVDHVAEEDAVDQVADDAAGEQPERQPPRAEAVEELAAPVEQQQEHGEGEDDQQHAPSRQQAPGRAGVADVVQVEEAGNHDPLLAEGEH